MYENFLLKIKKKSSKKLLRGIEKKVKKIGWIIIKKCDILETVHFIKQ